MASPFLGQITTFGFNFAPRGWLLCRGQILPISQYAALFSLLGTAFGGNGTTTFGYRTCRTTSPSAKAKDLACRTMSWVSLPGPRRLP